MEKTKVSAAWELRVEVLIEVVQKLDSVGEGLNWEFEFLVNEDVEVNLLVSPSNFKNLLESSGELS